MPVTVAEEGFKIFGTGRTIGNADLQDSIVRLPCDYIRDDETTAVFAKVVAEAEGLGLLVNSAWGGYERMTENSTFTWTLPFWEQPTHRWTSMMDAGVSAAFVSSSFAAIMMMPRHRASILLSRRGLQDERMETALGTDRGRRVAFRNCADYCNRTAWAASG